MYLVVGGVEMSPCCAPCVWLVHVYFRDNAEKLDIQCDSRDVYMCNLRHWNAFYFLAFQYWIFNMISKLFISNIKKLTDHIKLCWIQNLFIFSTELKFLFILFRIIMCILELNFFNLFYLIIYAIKKNISEIQMKFYNILLSI